LHESRGAAHAALPWRGWGGGWRRDAGVDQVYRGARVPCDVAGWSGGDSDQAAFVIAALGDSFGHRPESSVMLLADVQHNLLGVHGGRREHRAVEDQMRA